MIKLIVRVTLGGQLLVLKILEFLWNLAASQEKSGILPEVSENYLVTV